MKDAFEEYPVEEEWQKGKIENVLNEDIQSYNIDYDKGAIIGEADLVDCILVDKEIDQNLKQINSIVYGNNYVGNYAWKLENIKKYDKPIYVKVTVGLWNYEK